MTPNPARADSPMTPNTPARAQRGPLAALQGLTGRVVMAPRPYTASVGFLAALPAFRGRAP
jgi:hypothetical protein